ncbi:MAG: LrgB family protein [Eggerthellaceae bacterium]|jgi:predicted murein hydrolase (TIGR00659 family)
MSFLADMPFPLLFVLSTVVSIVVFELSVELYKRVKSPLLNPLLITLIGLMTLLTVLQVPVSEYQEGMKLFSFMLGPATVALAYSVYRQRKILKEHFLPIFMGCLVGSLVSMVSAYSLCIALGLGSDLAVSFIPKSVTTPIAIAASQELGGVTAITVAAVIITGILGAIFSPVFAKIFHVNDRVAKGVAIGACSHAVGTTKAVEMGKLEGAMSGVALAVSGLLTTIIVIVAHCLFQG